MSANASNKGGAGAARRIRCPRCRRPGTHCLCPHIPRLSNHTRVLVLQHPEEARHPLNTARLAVLGLKNAELRVGETFPGLEQDIAAAGAVALLFPGHPGCPVFSPGEAAHALDCLVVPDGTWRKARKLVQANPVLAKLPRLSLPSGAPSEYRVRKATEPAAVSTLEAIVRALAQLEPGQDFQPLLRPFRVMVEQQIEGMGEATFLRNHAVLPHLAPGSGQNEN